MNKSEFIDYFMEIIKNVLLKELPAEAGEREYIEKSYELTCIKLAHIKNRGGGVNV